MSSIFLKTFWMTHWTFSKSIISTTAMLKIPAGGPPTRVHPPPRGHSCCGSSQESHQWQTPAAKSPSKRLIPSGMSSLSQKQAHGRKGRHIYVFVLPFSTRLLSAGPRVYDKTAFSAVWIIDLSLGDQFFIFPILVFLFHPSCIYLLVLHLFKNTKD